MIDDYIGLDNQIRDEKNDKLERARAALADNILFYISNTFLKFSDILGEDISSLKEMLEKRGDSIEENIYYIAKALQKKIEKTNLIKIWIELLKRKATCYDDVDIILDCLVSELLYMGYSVEYLGEWWKESFSKDEVNRGELEALVNNSNFPHRLMC